MSCDFSALGSIDPNDPEQASALLQQCTDTLTDPSLWWWLIVFTIACAAVGALIGKYKKNSVMRDAILGAALGPIGWIISLCTPKARPKPQCPACKCTVDASDAHCRHCGAALAPSPARGRGLG